MSRGGVLATLLGAQQLVAPVTYPYDLGIVNAGGEDLVDVPWVNTIGTLARSNSYAYQGTYSIATRSPVLGGDGWYRVEGYQDRPIPAGAYADVDAGNVAVVFELMASNPTVFAAAGIMGVEPLTAGGASLSSKTMGGISRSVGTNVWSRRQVALRLPSGTRQVRVYLGSARDSNALESYFDALSAKLYRYITSIAMTNPGAETGDTTGWVNEASTLAVSVGPRGGINPHSGANLFYFNAAATGRARQDAAAPAGQYALIDAGKAFAWGLHQLAGFTDNDTGQVSLNFLSAAAADLGGSGNGGRQDGSAHPDYIWTQNTVVLPIPANTRTFRYKMEAIRNSGTNNDGYFDDCELHILGID